MKLISSLVFGIAVLAGTSVVGCAADDAQEPGESTAAVSSAIDVPNPSGAYFASITANGTGCPAGTWDAQISEDGKAFTVTFSGYETIVDPGKSFAIKDCQLAINLKSPEGYSFSISSFYYQGYAILDSKGMSAKQTAKYYFMGNPLPAQELTQDMAGPYDDSYVFSNQIGIADRVWSPCGSSRTLNAQTRLVLRNNPRRTGSGYLNAVSADGQVGTVFTFGIAWGRCTGGLPPTAVPL